MLTTMFLFTALAAPPIGSAPDALVIDGDLGEWTGPPTVALSPGDQFFGDAKVSGPDDSSARVWLAFDAAGLQVAARIRDDAVYLVDPQTDGDAVVRSDHLELWISFGEPPFPPMGYTSAQGGFHPIADNQACMSLSGEDVVRCRTWIVEQQKWRGALTRGFRSQILLSPAGVHRVIAGRVGAPVGVVRTAVGASDWSLEATVPWDVLPLTPIEPISSAAVLVELVDNDEGLDRQESMLSTSKGRKLSDPSSWNALGVDPPSAATHPAGLAAKLGTDSWFRPSAPSTDEVHRFVNQTLGYQWDPSRRSPQEVVHTLPVEPTATKGELALWIAPFEYKGELVVSRRGALTGYTELRCPDSDWVVDGDGWLVIGTCEAAQGEVALGPGGANPVQVAHVHRVDGSGSVESVLFATPAGEGVRNIELGTRGGRVQAVRLRGMVYPVAPTTAGDVALIWQER